MYAVGKVSSFISRSVYTVSGPFHPFGGAVDVVVVQQQDGSFKSSPWYVRFGKFQGVLKTREKVVNIAVNGEEAGFHMYLDSNGEAFFLRNGDPNLEKGEFIMSPVSSDDEGREVRVQDAQLRKSKSISCDSSTMETDATDGKILARRTTILDRMFGRKSAKDSAHAVDRVSSLERAEIAAELLDTNWSTNPSRAPRSRKSNDEPSKSNLADDGSGNLVETSKIVLPVGSFDHEKAVGSNCDSVDINSCSLRGGTNSSEDGNDCSIQTTIVKEEVVEMCTHDSGVLTDVVTSITEQPGSKSMSSYPGTDKIIGESVSTQSETLGNFEDDGRREMNTKEVFSHDIFEIHTIEADITHGKSEVFSQLVTTDSNGAHRNFIDANSPVHGTTCLSSEKHDISLVASAQDACEEKMVIISSSETLESSYDASGILVDKVCDAVSIPMPDDVQLEECSRFYTEKIEHVIFEDKPLSYYGASSNREETSNLDIQDKEIFVPGSSSSQISQANCPDNDISDDSVVNDHVTHSTHGSDVEISLDVVANDHSTHTCHDLAFQHDLVFPDASSSVVEISNYVPENGAGDVTTQGDVESKTCNGDLDIPVIHISTTGDETRECISESANSPDNVQPEGLQIFSDFSSLGKPEAEASQHDLVFPDASSSVVEISNYVSENDPEDVTMQTNVECKTCNGDLDIPVIHISTTGDETRECISQSVNSPDRVQPEGLQFFSDLSSVGKLEAETTKQEDDENRSSSASGVEVEIVPEATYEPKEEPEAVVSCSEFVEGIQFQFSDTESFADRNNIDDVIANKAACAGQHDEFDCGTEQQGRYDTALENNLENHFDSSRLETSPVPFPQSELHSGDDNLEAKSLPNLRSHIHDLERSNCAQLSRSLQSNGENNALENIVPIPGSELRSGDDNLEAKSLPNLCLHNHIHDLERSDCVQLSSSLQTNGENNGPENSVPLPGSELHSVDDNLEAQSLPNLSPHIHDIERSDYVQLSCSPQSNSENNGVDPVKTTNSVFPEQDPECPDDSEENCGPSELTSNGLPDDLKVDSFNPFAELSLCRHLLSEGMGADAACKAFDAEKISLEKFRAMKESLIRDSKLVVRIAGRYFPWDAAAPVVLGMVSFREEQVFESQGMIKVERVEPGGSWRIWPFSFKKTRSISTVQPVCESTVESSLPTPVKESDIENTKPSPRVKRMERKVRSLTPTSEELASLHLREGKNVVTFTFSTGMLGKQQVDAHIYLWKWNTRVVISDVDGTITKSDVLGQFMPLVGVDWSQNGVAHLFSAIKENGYQLLFLSARSISQAHITRQFLFNLKQDGKALPDGPVVISPDGLFPSLYREVIRRAPHEFKISCLETIKQLFPLDSLPFYAGFGNRDTDELSYLKVGIPMGKIFIINPKGEVAVNRRVDTKSYTSLHALVNGMFPPISSSSEQEDYNTWNYWKMPLPSVDI